MVEEQTEQTEQPIDQSKPKSNKKPFIIAGIVAFGVVFIIVAIVLCLCLKTPPKEEPAPSVDFSQKVTNTDGTEFKPTYDAGSDEDLSVRFTDLECNEDCSNISNLKIGNKILKAGEDYEVKRGSVIIVIYKKILQAIQNGQYDITFEIKSGEKTISVGLKITIANSSAPTDEEESENEDEQESGDQSQSGSSSQSSSESESSDETEEEKTEIPQDEKRKINLNDANYQVSYGGIVYWVLDEDGEPLDGAASFSIGGFTITNGSEIICEDYSNQAGEHGLTQKQFNEEQERINALGIYGGSGSFLVAPLSEQPSYCDRCGLVCERW